MNILIEGLKRGATILLKHDKKTLPFYTTKEKKTFFPEHWLYRPNALVLHFILSAPLRKILALSWIRSVKFLCAANSVFGKKGHDLKNNAASYKNILH